MSPSTPRRIVSPGPRVSALFQHFLDAQAPVCAQVYAELRAGKKRTHWMWFMFPQLAALGQSSMAKRFGLGDLNEAKAYAEHPALGKRLRFCVGLVNEHDGLSAHEIFGSPDDLKFRSCLTLFLRATNEDLFRAALAKYYAGEEDMLTLAALGFG